MPRPTIRLLQANLNHSARAQDLFLQTLVEWDINVAVAAEPYYVPDSGSDWIGDTLGLVAITHRSTGGSSTFSVLGRGGATWPLDAGNWPWSGFISPLAGASPTLSRTSTGWRLSSRSRRPAGCW